MSLKQVGVMIAVLGLLGVSTAGATVIAVGELTGIDNTNWLSQGLATLNGATAGVNWTVSGEQQPAVWNYNDPWSMQGNLGASPSPQVEWPTASSTTVLGYEISPTTLSLGSNIAALVGSGKALRISMVAPVAGTYSINGVSITATAVGKVLQWTETTPTDGELLAFTGSAYYGKVDYYIGDTHYTDVDGYYNSGPIGFSAVPIPEPSALVLLSVGLISLLAYAWRKRK